MTRLGQTAVKYNTANSATIAQNTDTVAFQATITNTGIYTCSYQTRFSAPATVFENSILTWMDVSNPAALTTFALTQISQTSPLELIAGAAMNGTWTGQINAGATLRCNLFMTYTSALQTGYLTGGLSESYMTVTRIA